MAIFSQSSHKTQIDFRKYDPDRPNRTVPYKLPVDIEKSLIALLDRLKLDSGSVDSVVCTAGNHYFLEVNPIGQFGMTSYPCNYPIERDIATYLS